MLSYMTSGSQPMQYAMYGGQAATPTLQSPTMVTQQPISQMGKPGLTSLPGYQATPKWSWMSTGFSLFALFCCSACGLICGPIFSVLALVFSVNAYSDHKSSDFKRSQKKIKCSWIFVILAITWGVIASITIGVLGASLPIADWIGTLTSTP